MVKNRIIAAGTVDKLNQLIEEANKNGWVVKYTNIVYNGLKAQYYALLEKEE